MVHNRFVLVDEARVGQDGNASYYKGETARRCFEIKKTNVSIDVKVYINDCKTSQFNDWSYTNESSQLCIVLPNVQEQHRIEVQLVHNDASLSCFDVVYLKIRGTCK